MNGKRRRGLGCVFLVCAAAHRLNLGLSLVKR